MLLLVSNKTHTYAHMRARTHTRMHARTHARMHTHTSHVLVNTHALNVSCIRHFQELSVNQGKCSKIDLVNTKDFLFCLV